MENVKVCCAMCGEWLNKKYMTLYEIKTSYLNKDTRKEWMSKIFIIPQYHCDLCKKKLHFIEELMCLTYYKNSKKSINEILEVIKEVKNSDS